MIFYTILYICILLLTLFSFCNILQSAVAVIIRPFGIKLGSYFYQIITLATAYLYWFGMKSLWIRFTGALFPWHLVILIALLNLYMYKQIKTKEDTMYLPHKKVEILVIFILFLDVFINDVLPNIF